MVVVVVDGRAVVVVEVLVALVIVGAVVLDVVVLVVVVVVDFGLFDGFITRFDRQVCTSFM